MRDQRFVAVHRGGLLSKEHHRLLIRWAHNCAEHVLPLLGEGVDERLRVALETAKAWERGEASVGAAQKAAWAAHALARELTNPVAVMVAWAVGHAVATAHMADHSLGAAEFALKAVKAAGRSVELERTWQDEQLPAEVRELVLSARETIRARSPGFVA
ncbi:MAG: putative immunity protein [Deinococcota bacterium]